MSSNDDLLKKSSVLQKKAQENLIAFQIATNPNYVPNWHHRIIASELEKIEAFGDRDYKVLLVFVPPRHGKSELCSIGFPAWYLGRNPTKEIITVSYSAELAQDFGGKTRTIVSSESYPFSDVTLKEDEQAKAKWRTNKGGSYTSVGVGGAITGRGANILLFDDPIKNREEAESEVYREKVWQFFTSTAFTRLEPKGVVVVILTRWHLDDLAGRILKNLELSKRCKVIHFPAIATHKEIQREEGDALWPERFDAQALEEIKNTIGPYDWSALYQGQPIATERQEFKPEWWRKVPESYLTMMNTRRFLTVDTAISKASSADYTGFCDNRIDNQNFWYFKAWRMRLGAEELVDAIFALHQKNNYEKIGIEKTVYLDGLKPYLDAEQRKRNRFLPIVEMKHNQTAKETRIRGLIPRYATASIFHIEGECNDLEEEQMQFPQGIHDDVLDACFIKGTKILTNKGQKNIEDIRVGDRVMTRLGFEEVTAAWMSGKKRVINNIGLVGTPNHPIITTQGIMDLQYVDESNILHIWNEKLSCIEERSITDIRNQRDISSGFTFGGTIKQMPPHTIFTDRYGLTTLERYLSSIIFITKTAIRSIMSYLISNVFLLQITPNITGIAPRDWNNNGNSLRLVENLQKNGTAQKRGSNGTKNMLKVLSSGTFQSRKPVKNVSKSLRPDLRYLLYSALNGVNRALTLVISGVKTQTITKRKVYNLEVKNAHEYFANGILVHNCAYQLQVTSDEVGGGQISVSYLNYDI